MSIRLIALDMDGTLLNDKSQLSVVNRKALEKAMAAGIYVVPATGRVYSTLPEPVKALPGIQYVLSSNGAAVYRVGESKPIYTHFMSREKALEIYHAIKDVPCIKEFYMNGKGYFEADSRSLFDTLSIPEPFRGFYGTIKTSIADVEGFLQAHPHGVEKINLPWLTQELQQVLKERIDTIQDIAVTSSLGRNLELNQKGCHKGDGLRGLCAILGLDMSEVMAVGDSNNDFEMIQEAGYGVAMANATEEIKSVAKYITLSNEENGVAAAIDTFCFGR